jgi:hypothetical protein
VARKNVKAKCKRFFTNSIKASVKCVSDSKLKSRLPKGEQERGVQIVRAFLWQSLEAEQIVSFEELLMSQVIQQQTLTRFLAEKGIFTKEKALFTIQLTLVITKKSTKYFIFCPLTLPIPPEAGPGRFRTRSIKSALGNIDNGV